MEERFYIRRMGSEDYVYQPVELVIGKDAKPYGCECYAYRTKDKVLHMIQCEQCGNKSEI